MTTDHGPQPSELQTEVDRLKLDLNSLVIALLMKGLINLEDLESAMCEMASIRELHQHLEQKYGK